MKRPPRGHGTGLLTTPKSLPWLVEVIRSPQTKIPEQVVATVESPARPPGGSARKMLWGNGIPGAGPTVQTLPHTPSLHPTALKSAPYSPPSTLLRPRHPALLGPPRAAPRPASPPDTVPALPNHGLQAGPGLHPLNSAPHPQPTATAAQTPFSTPSSFRVPPCATATPPGLHTSHSSPPRPAARLVCKTRSD